MAYYIKENCTCIAMFIIVKNAIQNLWFKTQFRLYGLTGGFLLLQNFSVAISVSPHVCLS